MAHLINKDALVAEIVKIRKALNLNLRHDQGVCDGLYAIQKHINTLEVKEVDLELVTDWFDHIAQIADDRMTLTNQRMTDAHALDEIKCLAKNSSEFITRHYKAQKGNEV